MGILSIPLTDRARPLIAFSTPDGAHYHIRVMLFTLKNAPATFEQLMVQEVLVAYLQKFAIAKLDDIIVDSENTEQHMQHLQLVFERLANHDLRCTLEKCHFGSSDRILGAHRNGRKQPTTAQAPAPKSAYTATNEPTLTLLPRAVQLGARLHTRVRGGICASCGPPCK